MKLYGYFSPGQGRLTTRPAWGCKIMAMVVLLLVSASLALAKSGNTSTILGLVTDSSGAAVPNVAVGKEVGVDVQPQPGAATEPVTVTASPVALDTANAPVGLVIAETQVTENELPLTVLNRAQRVQKLAKQIRSTAKGY